MSEQAKLDPAAAGFNKLFNEVRVPAFFSKLAEHGIRPRDRRQAERLLEMGAQLGAANRERLQKEAAAGGDFYDQIADELPHILAGRDPARAAVKQAAYVHRLADAHLAEDEILEAAHAYASAHPAI